MPAVPLNETVRMGCTLARESEGRLYLGTREGGQAVPVLSVERLSCPCADLSQPNRFDLAQSQHRPARHHYLVLDSHSAGLQQQQHSVAMAVTESSLRIKSTYTVQYLEEGVVTA